jgi:diguanylate cyclase (GGDEF)-like protein
MTPLGLDPGLARAVLVLVSLAVAVLSAHAGQELARRVRAVPTGIGLRWLAGAAGALATGVWSLHALALLDHPLPYPIGEHPLGSAAVWLVAALTATCGFGAVSGRVMTWPRLVCGAAGLGAALASAQAAALLAPGLRPGIEWQTSLLAVAVLVAAGGSVAAQSLLFQARSRPRQELRSTPWLAATLFGGALVVSQALVVEAAALPSQTYSAYEDLIPVATLAALGSVGAVAALAVVLVLSALEAQLRAALRRAQSDLQRLSFRDPLTKLPNRLMAEGTIAELAQEGEAEQGRFAVLFVNLDGFKPVNESLGHGSGDRLLRAVASRLKAHASSRDLVAHLGGDEFLLIVRGTARPDETARLSVRLLEAIRQPCRLGGREAAVPASVGVALFPDHGPASSLIAHAEAAMRAAKGGGGGTWCLFEPRMVDGAREQVELLQDLRGALAQGQFELYYQPKVHAPSGEITGAEALLRWHHPKRGIIGPAIFIPIAERFGLIGAMGDWVIDEACRQARAWRDQGLLMRVAINLSVHQLRNPGLVARIVQALHQHQVNPRLLTFEVTESVAMEDADGAIAAFEKLAEAGVHVAIDDFGTGYSSLSYLRKLRAVELKIDRSFVLDVASSNDARAVVDAVIKLAQALGLKVVAEGVETEEQHQILRSLGCDELQGYLFAKPMPAKALAVWAIEDVGPRALDFRDSLYQATTPGALH